MSKSFRTIQEILDSSRRGDSLYEIYKTLAQSKNLLQEQQKNAFEVLFDALIPFLTEDLAQELVEFPITSLEIYSSNISISLCEILLQFKGESLSLNSIQEIDVGSLKILSRLKGLGLSLNGLKKINVNESKILSQFCCKNLALNGIKDFDKNTIDSLVEYKGSSLSLNGLEYLNENILRALSRFRTIPFRTSENENEVEIEANPLDTSSLFLNAVKQIEDSAVSILADLQVDSLYLNGLKELNKSIGTALGEFPGENLFLNGITKLEEVVANEIARFGWIARTADSFADSWLEIEQVIESGVARIFGDVPNMNVNESVVVTVTPAIYLDGIEEISQRLAKNLVKFECRGISLSGLKKIDEESAETLIQWSGNRLILNGLEKISERVAKIFAQFRGGIVTTRKITEQISKFK